MESTQTFNKALMVAKILGMLGRPPLLPDEDASRYDALLAEVVGLLQPRNFIAGIWVKDVVDRIWDSLRFQRIKPAWITANSLLSPSVSSEKAYNYELSALEAAIKALEAMRVLEALQESSEIRRDKLLAFIEAHYDAPSIAADQPDRAEALPVPPTATSGG